MELRFVVNINGSGKNQLSFREASIQYGSANIPSFKWGKGWIYWPAPEESQKPDADRVGTATPPTKVCFLWGPHIKPTVSHIPAPWVGDWINTARLSLPLKRAYYYLPSVFFETKSAYKSALYKMNEFLKKKKTERGREVLRKRERERERERKSQITFAVQYEFSERRISKQSKYVSSCNLRKRRFGWVSLFKWHINLRGLFLPKPSLKKDSSGTI